MPKIQFAFFVRNSKLQKHFPTRATTTKKKRRRWCIYYRHWSNNHNNVQNSKNHKYNFNILTSCRTSIHIKQFIPKNDKPVTPGAARRRRRQRREVSRRRYTTGRDAGGWKESAMASTSKQRRRQRQRDSLRQKGWSPTQYYQLPD